MVIYEQLRTFPSLTKRQLTDNKFRLIERDRCTVAHFQILIWNLVEKLTKEKNLQDAIFFLQKILSIILSSQFLINGVVNQLNFTALSKRSLR